VDEDEDQDDDEPLDELPVLLCRKLLQDQKGFVKVFVFDCWVIIGCETNGGRADQAL